MVDVKPFRWEGDLDRRRRRAHQRAVLSVALGVAIQALYAAALALIALAAVVRFTTWISRESFVESPLWHYGGWGAAAFAAIAFALTAFFTAWGAVRGSGRWLLAGIALRDGTPDELRQVGNIVDALAIGLGAPPPAIRVIDEPAPNAISGRSGGSRTICVTSGLLQLPRDEIEAVCAHELVELHNPDASLIGAAFMALIRARNSSTWIAGLGATLFVLALGAAFQAEIFLPSVFIVGIVLMIVSGLALVLLQGPLDWLRRSVDDVADVAAVHLARHPTALAAVLERLAADDRRVGSITDRSEYVWFEVVERVDPPPAANAGVKPEDGKAQQLEHEEKIARANSKAHSALTRRAALAAATARGLSPRQR